MVKNFKLVQKDETSFENVLCVNVLQSETISLTFSELDFSFVKANVKVNNIFVGATTNGQIGIHSSKLKSGFNELTVDFLNSENVIVKTLKYQFVVIASKNDKSIDEELNSLYCELALLKNKVNVLETWKTEIDNERSGF